MNYLITAAGEGSRFLQKGIKPPKPLIKIYGNELLLWSLSTFNFNSKDKLFIVTQKSHQVREKLYKKLRIIYPNIKIFWLELERLLNGQLLTSLTAISHFKIKGKLIIHNCDSSFKYNNLEIDKLLESNIFGIIPCFEAKGNHWSFAKSSNSDKNSAIEVREKVRISNNCSVGTYIFSSSEKLLNLFEEYIKEYNPKNKEQYIAPIYQFAIEKNMKVIISKANEVKIFGTPDELVKSFNVNMQEFIGENGFDAHQRKTLVVDIDNTLCKKDITQQYSEAIPITKVCDALRKADKLGAYIILFTSRNMRTFKGSIGLINKFTAPIILKWLSENKIPYDEIYFGKPWGNSLSYIDDKNISIENFIKEYEKF